MQRHSGEIEFILSINRLIFLLKNPSFAARQIRKQVFGSKIDGNCRRALGLSATASDRRNDRTGNSVMKKLSTASVIALILSSTGVPARDLAPLPLLPDHIPFVSPPGLSGVQAAQILGNPSQPTPYLVRVKLAVGTQIPPHTHPDERSSTVLSGTLYVGFGETFTESRVVAIPAGGVYIAPADIPHYLWAKDGEVIYQEAGTGPTGVTFVKPQPCRPSSDTGPPHRGQTLEYPREQP